MSARAGLAVRPSEGLNPAGGPPPLPGAVAAFAPGPRADCDAFRALVRSVTTYAAEATYSGVHQTLRRRRGPASERACWRCGRRARVWSCVAVPDDRRRGVSNSGAAVWYSTDPSDYQPACGVCAARDDREHAEARRAAAGLGVTPLRKTERPMRTRPEPEPMPEPLFDLNASAPSGWSLP